MVREPIVTTYHNRACITDEMVMEFPPELIEWVETYCERPEDPAVFVWLLPVGDNADGE